MNVSIANLRADNPSDDVLHIVLMSWNETDRVTQKLRERFESDKAVKAFAKATKIHWSKYYRYVETVHEAVALAIYDQGRFARA